MGRMDAMPDFVREYWTLHLSFRETLLRLVSALGVGAMIGLDREWRSRPAGLRTHMLVAMASALFTILAFEIFEQIQAREDRVTADPLRLLEAITAGVAFLAAGAILRREDKVVGVTTGGGLWFAGAIGMACGLGQILLAFLGAGLAVVVLAVLGAVERKITK
jgi:putative Mg2+ transporter-C (MgtC) family protein